MGDFRIEIRGTGGHGCQREKKHGEKVDGCGDDNCPDCMARRFVASMKARSMLNFSSNYATLTHWPGQQGQVQDDLLTGIRKGDF